MNNKSPSVYQTLIQGSQGSIDASVRHSFGGLAKCLRPTKWIQAWQTNHRTRQQLALLPAHLLEDIGLTEAERAEEVCKPFWRQ